MSSPSPIPFAAQLDDPLLAWRQRTVAQMVRLVVVLFLPLTLVNLVNQMRLERWSLVIVQISVTLIVLGLLAVRPRDAWLQASAIVGFLLAMGLSIVASLGLFGVQPVLLVAASMLAAILLGQRAGTLVAVLGIGGFVVILGSFGLGLAPYPYESVRHATEWQVILNNAVSMSSTTVLLVFMVKSLVDSLQASFQTTRVALADLERMNSSLEASVQARTEELRRSQSLLQSVNDALPNGYLYQVLQYQDGRYVGHTYLSRGVETLLGLTPEEIRMNPALLHDTIHPDDRPMVDAVDRESARSLTAFEVELRRRKADGSIGWFQIRSLPQLRPDGLVLWNGICLEITARKMAELALATSETKYRTLFALLPTGVTLADEHGQIIEANPASERLLGMSGIKHQRRHADDREWDIIQPDGTPFPPEDFPSVRAPREGRIITDVEMGVGHADGSRTWISVSAAPLTQPPYGVVVTYTDITALTQAVAQLAQARDAAEAATRAKSAFLASMSHELRTPLNAVIGMAALLQETTLTAEQRVFATTIDRGGEALLAVISDILDFSRIESGRMMLTQEPFDLHACLHTAVDLVSHGARAKGLTVAATLEPGLPSAVVGDMERLRQVLLNLLGNAVKFTHHGAVSLRAAAQAGDGQTVQVCIAIVDTGIGLTLEQQEAIFEPFVQAEHNTARSYGGTGLGLAISRQLVELMGGRLAVVSSPGVGSTFSVCVPLQIAAMDQAPRPEEPAALAPRPLAVLVAEDNPVNQEVIRRLLGHLGHQVTVVENGQLAVEAVAQQAYDVVLMDVLMPLLDGEAATRQIRALGPAVRQPRIIALTANAMAGDRERFLNTGMDDYLSKPVRTAELRQALARVAAQPLAASETQASAQEPWSYEGAALIEWEILASLRESLGPEAFELMRTIVDLFAEDIPPLLDELEQAMTQADLTRLRQAAHRMRGSSLQIGAHALTELCAQIERAGAMTDLDLPTQISRLRACYAQTLRVLREHDQGSR